MATVRDLVNKVETVKKDIESCENLIKFYENKKYFLIKSLQELLDKPFDS